MPRLLSSFLSWLFGIDKMLDDFEAAFPGKCPVCAYHRYEVLEGHASGSPPEHRCIEHR